MTIMIHFEKMHGLGNDFVIIDERKFPMQLVEAQQREEAVRRIAARTTGVGCDQLLVLRYSPRADAYMQIYNADGSEVGACGNATRCVGWMMMREKHADAALIDTEAGMLECRLAGKERVSVNMSAPRLSWQEIPLATATDTLHIPIESEMLRDGVAVSMGNPHLVFFVDDVAAIPLQRLGSALEHHPLFPQRVNVSVAHVISPNHIQLRVWERGCGETMACGTGACATFTAARRRGLVHESATVSLQGGDLEIHWKGTESDPAHPLWMTGAIAHSFSGTLNDSQWV
jgi:diaminopimelate epimerase